MIRVLLVSLLLAGCKIDLRSDTYTINFESGRRLTGVHRFYPAQDSENRGKFVMTKPVQGAEDFEFEGSSVLRIYNDPIKSIRKELKEPQ